MTRIVTDRGVWWVLSTYIWTRVKTASTMKRGAFVMYPMHAVLLNFRMDSRLNPIYNVQTLMGFVHFENEEEYSTVQRIDDWECSGNKDISESSKLGNLVNLVAQTTVSKRREERISIVHIGIPSI